MTDRSYSMCSTDALVYALGTVGVVTKAYAECYPPTKWVEVPTRWRWLAELVLTNQQSAQDEELLARIAKAGLRKRDGHRVAMDTIVRLGGDYGALRLYLIEHGFYQKTLAEIL